MEFSFTQKMYISQYSQSGYGLLSFPPFKKQLTTLKQQTQNSSTESQWTNSIISIIRHKHATKLN